MEGGMNVSDSLFTQKYTVLKVLCSDHKINCYIAQKKNQEKDKFVLVNEICDRKIINQYIPQIVTLSHKRLTDFVECFTEDSKLYVVFSYTNSTNLKKELERQKMPFEFRVILIQKILQKIIEKGSFPNVLKANVLHWENILFEENRIDFNYRFFAEGMDKSQKKEVFFVFETLLQHLFHQDELENNSKLHIVLEKCQKQIYHSFGEVLKDLQDVLTSMDEEKDLKTLALEKKKKLQKNITQAFMILVAITAGFVVYQKFAKDTKDTTVYSDVEKIGTVQLVEPDKKSEIQDNVYIPKEEVSSTEQPEDEADKNTESLQEPTNNSEENKENTKVTEAKEAKEDTAKEASPETEPKQEYKIYYVKKNDSITKIVRQEYGSDDMVQEVIRLNGIKNGSIIYRGQAIKLPIINQDK